MSDYQFNKTILAQMESVIIPLSKVQYSSSLDVLSGASVGQHVRHILDFYLCILNAKNNVVCYDGRQRDPETEHNPEYAVGVCKGIVEGLASVDHRQNVEIHSEMNGHPLQYDSSFGREMIYAFDHAIHHLALIKIGLKVIAPEVNVPKNLGVAPSTIKFRGDQRCAR